MRKPLTPCLILSLSACFVTTGLTGCGDKSNDAQVAIKLENLLDRLSRTEHSIAAIESNEQPYTKGVMDGKVAVPGAMSQSSAYIDQAVALLPLAQEIVNEGNESQKQAAYKIISTIRADEGAFLLGVSQSAFQTGFYKASRLRDQVLVLSNISSMTQALSADRDTLMNTIKDGGVDIQVLKDKATASKRQLTALQQGLQAEKREIEGKADKTDGDTLRLELITARLLDLPTLIKLNDEIAAHFSATETAIKKYKGLNKKGEEARGDEPRAADDHPPLVGLAFLEAKVSELTGKRDAQKTKLSEAKEKIEKLKAEVAKNEKLELQLVTESRSADSKERYQKLDAASLARQKAATAQAELQSLQTVDVPTLTQLIAHYDQDIQRRQAAIKALKAKANALQQDQASLKTKLDELGTARTNTIAALIKSIQQADDELHARAFKRLAAASDRLKQASDALAQAGQSRGGLLDQMSVFTLHARVVHQQTTAVRAYLTTLQSLAATDSLTGASSVGADLLGEDVRNLIKQRIANLRAYEEKVKEAVATLSTDAATTVSAIEALDGGSEQGQRGQEHIKLFSELMLKTQFSSGEPDSPDPPTDDTADDAPSPSGDE